VAHCNDPKCTRSTRYDGDDRFCACECGVCKAATKQVRQYAEAGTCEACRAPIEGTDDFCDACGARISAKAKERARAKASDEMYSRNIATSQQHAKVAKASSWIGVLACLFAGTGTVMWLMQRGEAQRALQNISALGPDQVLTYEGVEYKVSALRSKIEALPAQTLLVHLTLAALFAALFVWGKRSPIPAIATALAVFIVVHLVNFLLDPSTLVQGIIIKVIAIGALAAGLKAALANAPPADQRG
jgi:hypothetical protein